MQFNTHLILQVSSRSDIGFVKREIHRLAEGIGFKAEQLGKIDIVVMEISSNLIKHNAVEGNILIKSLEGIPGLEIIGIDNGPGMKEPLRMMEDGVSTYGSSGEGLGAIKRLSDFFDMYSKPGIGTIILSRFFVKTPSKPSAQKNFLNNIGAVIIPLKGETLSGDGAVYRLNEQRLTILTLDGLGHGVEANNAVNVASETMLQLEENLPSVVLRTIHSRINKTRGAVGSVISMDFQSNELTYCGIGNIAVKIINNIQSKNLISYNGTLGYNIPRTIHDNKILLEEQSMVIIHSDGIKTRWELTRYPEISRHDPSIVAAMLYKDFSRKTDDSLVIAIKNNSRHERRYS